MGEGSWGAGAALTIPPLLMPSPELGSIFVEQFENPQRLPDSKLGDVACFVLKGRREPGDETVWIDQATLLVRQVVDEADFEGTHIVRTTSITPELDVDIASSELAFETPRVGVLPPAVSGH